MHSILPDRELRAWIRLSQEPGLGPAQARGLLAAVGLPHDIFALSASSLAKFVPHDLARQLSLPAHENTELARSEEHTSELQYLMRISYAVFCLKTKKNHKNTTT